MAINAVLDLGVDNTGASDISSIVNAQIAAPSSEAIYFPAGEYRIDGTIDISNGMKLYGDGWATHFRPASHTADVFVLSGQGAELCGARWSPLVERGGGYFVRMSAPHTRLDDYYMTGAYGAVAISDNIAISTVSRGSVRNTAPGGVVIDVFGGFDISVRDLVADNEPDAQPAAGIRVWKTGDLTVEDGNIIHCGDDLLICPGDGQVVASVNVNNTFLDTAVNGLKVAPTGNGSVVRCILDQVWMSSHSQRGAMLDPAIGASIDGVDFNGCHLFGNALDGVAVANARAKNITIDGSAIAGNGGSAVSLGADMVNAAVLKSRLGPTHGFGPNLIGIWSAGGSGTTGLRVIGNVIKGNSAAQLSLGSMPAAPTNLVTDNV